MSMKVLQNETNKKTGGSSGICYGSIVFISVTIITINSTIPLACFGIVFGNFLRSLGDETTGTSMANGIFNMVFSFTGLASNFLLNKWSCKDVGVLGGVMSTIGAFALFFVEDKTLFMVFFGVFEGFGYGLLSPASLTALNNYFDKKLPFCLSLSCALMISLVMLCPPLATSSLEIFGYRGTLLWHGAITFLNIPASLALFRNSCNYKKIPQEDVGENIVNYTASTEDNQISVKYKSNEHENDLKSERNNSGNTLLKDDNDLNDVNFVSKDEVLRSENLIKLTTNNMDKENSINNAFWKSIISSVDFSLLGSMKYLNLSFGLSLGFTSDIIFISIIPLMLTNAEFNVSEIATSMTVFFGSDLVSRILLSIFSAVRSPNSRQLFLFGSLLSFIFRIAFVNCQSFIWKTATLAALGFLRCFIQTPLPLVVSEVYPDQFATAYSLYMVICGIVGFIVSLLIGILKTVTGSDEMVCHLLTSCYVVCVISWVIETLIKNRRKEKNVTEESSSA